MTKSVHHAEDPSSEAESSEAESEADPSSEAESSEADAWDSR